MSTHRVDVTTIVEVMPHPNADRLDLVRVFDWVCVTSKGQFKAGDRCLYIPIDSVLPPTVEAELFPADSKIKLSKSRVKSIKIRGCVSQGMAVRPEVLGIGFGVSGDVAGTLGITKYEPPKKAVYQGAARDRRRARRARTHPEFKKYTDLENIKYYPGVFQENEPVVVTEKIHGTNFRAGWLPFVPQSWWEKVKGYFGFNPEWEFVYGSRNVQLQRSPNAVTWLQKKGRTEENVYEEAVRKYRLRDVLPKGTVVYGEVYGPDIQKGYHYGLKSSERKLAVFDIMENGKYLDADDTIICCRAMGVPHVPLIYAGPYNKEAVKAMAAGDSVLDPLQKVREGVVVKPVAEAVSACGRKILKVINDDYLLGKHADEEVAHDQVS